jgi:hypothetical protein
MPKNRKPRAPDHSQSSTPKLSRRAILSGLGIGVVARRLRAGEVEPSATDGEKPPDWVEALAKCTPKYIQQSGWNAKKEYRELKLLTLRMTEINKNSPISVTRDVAATPTPLYQPKPGGKKS